MTPEQIKLVQESFAKVAPISETAAVLFYDFLISEAQPIFASRDFVSPSRKIDSPFTKAPLQLIDSTVMLDSAQKWQDLYQKTVISPGR